MLYTGVSALVGKNQELAISAGLSSTEVSRLKSPEFVVGNEYDPIGFSRADTVEQVVRASPFVAVSYNLARFGEKRSRAID